MKGEIYEQLRSFPKADLHVHFEGTVTPTTLRELAERNGLDLRAPTNIPGYPEIPAPRIELLQSAFSGSFFDFIQCYVKITSSIRTVADFELVAERYGAAAQSENIQAVEMYFTPTTFLALGLDETLIIRGLNRATEILTAKYGVKTNWIFDIVRNGNAAGEKTLDIAKRFREEKVAVIAVGLAGLEAGYPVTPFATALLAARREGFLIYVHAGETAGPESIRETMSLVAPDRIGHGVRAVDDRILMQELKDKGIPLEVCPWSNIALNVYQRENHPLRSLIEAGLNIVIASDDPGIFGKSLSENYLLAYESGVPLKSLEALAEHSLSLSKRA